MKSNTILKTGAIICGLAVIIGAFGAHALKPILEANDRVSPYETGVLYQMFHGLAILALGIISQTYSSKWISRAFWCLLFGVILFSGSLYGLSIWKIGILGPITPIGGVFFVIGWVCLFIGVKQ
ncbi:MAG: DUF423 domain-containing protein [Bacteroidia bacterium]|nr:DUF423 domain-containing protein [Bacteroidia bacterium]